MVRPRESASRRKENPVIAFGSGQSVRLRPWRLADLEPYREWLRPHQEWHQWDGPYFPVIGDEAADQYVARLREIVETQGGVAWSKSDDDTVERDLPPSKVVVADLASDELVGTVGWHWESRETDWARMGITIFDTRLRGSGRGTEALRLWTSYLFDATDWRRLDYATWSGNTAMVRAGEKLGFTVEGRFRDARVVRGEVYDSVVLGVLRDEWHAGTANARSGRLVADSRLG